jgi:hypothetical protein
MISAELLAVPSLTLILTEPYIFVSQTHYSASTQQHQNINMHIKFNPSQAQKCCYPPCCTVIRFTFNEAIDNILPVSSHGYRQTLSKQYLYDISINQSDNLSYVNEAELAFGIECKVYITSDGAADMNVIGTVLSCKRKKRSAKGANANVYSLIGDQ